MTGWSRVDYALTDLGHSLIVPLSHLSASADHNLAAIETAGCAHEALDADAA